MAIIECPECVTQISSRAAECPRCGFPLASTPAPSPRQKDGRRLAGLIGSVVGRMGLAGMLLASAITWEAPPVALAAAIVLGSIGPLWWKARREDRLGSSAGLHRLQAATEQMVEEVDRRREADAELMARRIEDLEERLDFAERFFAPQRAEERDPAEQLLIPERR